MHRFIRLCAVLSLTLIIAAFSRAGETAPVMAIMHTNDVHGRFGSSAAAIGHDRVAAIFRDLRRRIPAAVLLDAGDAVQGTMLVKWNKGEAAIEIMNAAGYDGLVLGNHEFDYGWDAATGLAGMSDFPFFTQPVVSGGAPGFEAAALYERGGRRIGVFGLTTPETRRSSGGGFGKDFGDTADLVAYADAMAASLRRAGAEIVVCLAHLGVDDQGFVTSYELRDRTDGIDVIIDGHSHTPLADIVQAEGKALIVSAGEHCEMLGVVEFFCENGRLVPKARSVFKADTLDIPPDPLVRNVIAKWTRETEARGAEVVAWLPAALEADRVRVRTRETPVGNALTDAMRAAAGSEIALLNGGNIRAPLPAGDVTAADIDAMLPYDTTIISARISGGVLREALELSVSRYPGEFGGFLQASGLSFAFDPKRPAGKRLTRVEIAGKPLDDEASYLVSVCDWLAAGGDGYEMLAAPFTQKQENGVSVLIDVFLAYLERNGDRPPTVEGRIVVVSDADE